MAEEDMHRGVSSPSGEKDDTGDTADQSFRDHVGKLHEKRAEKGIEDLPGSASSGDGGRGRQSRHSGGSPLTEMNSDYLGGLAGSDSHERIRSDELVREVRLLREELRAQTRALNHIATAIENT